MSARGLQKKQSDEMMSQPGMKTNRSEGMRRNGDAVQDLHGEKNELRKKLLN